MKEKSLLKMCKKDICKLWKLIMIPKGFGELHENEEIKAFKLLMVLELIF